MSDTAHCIKCIYNAEHCGRYLSSVFMQMVVIVLMIWFKQDTPITRLTTVPKLTGIHKGRHMFSADCDDQLT